MTRLELRLDVLKQSLERLKEATDVDVSAPLAVDGTIQRFEFAFELFWKTLKVALSYEGVDAATPRETLREAFNARWLDDDSLALGMLEARNLTSHTYDEELAREIHARIPSFLRMMKDTLTRLELRNSP